MQNKIYKTSLHNNSSPRARLYNLVQETICSDDFAWLTFRERPWSYGQFIAFNYFDIKGQGTDRTVIITSGKYTRFSRNGQTIKSEMQFERNLDDINEVISSGVIDYHYQEGYARLAIGLGRKERDDRRPTPKATFDRYKVPNDHYINVLFGKKKIDIATDDESLAKKLGKFPKIITHNDPDVEIDMRNIAVKFLIYLGCKLTGKPFR